MNEQLVLDIFAQHAGTPAASTETLLPEPVRPRVTYEDFDAEKLYAYAGIDCVATSDLLAGLWPSLTTPLAIIEQADRAGKKSKEGPMILDSFLGLEVPSHEFLLDLEINGMAYSVARNENLSKKMIVEVAALEDKIFSQIGKRIDLNSGPAVAQFLYEERGHTPPTMTKAGLPATDGEALMTLAGLDPTGQKYKAEDEKLQYLADMAKRRDISSVHNTFIKTYVRDFVKRDGRLHPSYNQFGTSSFRITGSDPNLTQLPRAKHGYNVRVCYVVDKGKVFISFDFSSAEVKVLANISKEPAMLKAIADGLDFHSFSASAMRNIPYAEFAAVVADKTHPQHKVYKEYRQLAKILTFSLLYGSSVGGIAAQLFLEKSKAEELVSMYFKTFPRIQNYIDGSHQFALNNQFSITPLEQLKRQYGTFPCFKPTAAYNASLRNSQNFIIQSTTSTIGLVTFAELNERIKRFGAKSICTVYDSIEIECPIEHAADVINIAYSTLDKFPLEQFPFLELPIGCEGDVGISWGETEIVHAGISQTEIPGIISKLEQKSILDFGSLIY